jgi:hypothetical protein
LLLPQLHYPTLTLTLVPQLPMVLVSDTLVSDMLVLISEPMVLFHMLLISLVPQLPPTLLPNVKLKLMPIQLTSTMDGMDMPDTVDLLD